VVVWITDNNSRTGQATCVNYAYGIAVVVGFLVLWFVFLRLFVWLTFMVTSLFPHIGKRHRHDRWDEFNRR
jgi:hypothetical protein